MRNYAIIHGVRVTSDKSGGSSYVMKRALLFNLLPCRILSVEAANRKRSSKQH